MGQKIRDEIHAFAVLEELVERVEELVERVEALEEAAQDSDSGG